MDRVSPHRGTRIQLDNPRHHVIRSERSPIRNQTSQLGRPPAPLRGDLGIRRTPDGRVKEQARRSQRLDRDCTTKTEGLLRQEAETGRIRSGGSRNTQIKSIRTRIQTRQTASSQTRPTGNTAARHREDITPGLQSGSAIQRENPRCRLYHTFTEIQRQKRRHPPSA